MTGSVRRWLRRARTDEGGAVESVELLLMVPLLVWAVCAFMAFTDGFRVRAMAVDATALVADTLSRQTTPVDRGDLDGLRSVAGLLSGHGGGIKLRVTQVYCERDCDSDRRVLRIVFSRGSGLDPMSDGDLGSAAYREKVPLMSRGDRVLLVETQLDYEPIFRVGLRDATVKTVEATRMRFAPRLCWETCSGSVSS